MSELDSLDELYEMVVMEHHRNPRNTEPVKDANRASKLYNPLCGDESVFQAKVEDGKIIDLAVFGRGCAISQASGSIMSEILSGLALQPALKHIANVRAVMKGDTIEEHELDALGDMNAMLGVRKYPVRIKCALLSWTVAEDALKS